MVIIMMMMIIIITITIGHIFNHTKFLQKPVLWLFALLLIIINSYRC
jgi:hypothetical protein